MTIIVQLCLLSQQQHQRSLQQRQRQQRWHLQIQSLVVILRRGRVVSGRQRNNRGRSQPGRREGHLLIIQLTMVRIAYFCICNYLCREKLHKFYRNRSLCFVELSWPGTTVESFRLWSSLSLLLVLHVGQPASQHQRLYCRRRRYH